MYASVGVYGCVCKCIRVAVAHCSAVSVGGTLYSKKEKEKDARALAIQQTIKAAIEPKYKPKPDTNLSLSLSHYSSLSLSLFLRNVPLQYSYRTDHKKSRVSSFESLRVNRSVIIIPVYTTLACVCVYVMCVSVYARPTPEC